MVYMKRQAAGVMTRVREKTAYLQVSTYGIGRQYSRQAAVVQSWQT